MGTEMFNSKQLTEEQQTRVNIVRHNFSQLFDYLDSYIPTGREKALYRTKLEEASMWAVKAIAEEKEIEG